MNRYPLWKYILILVLIGLGVIYALPNLYGEDYAIQLSRKASFTAASPSNASDMSASIRTSLQDANVPFISIHSAKPGTFLIRFKESEQQNKARDVLQADFGKTFSVALNLAPKTPAWLLDLGAQPMRLGLDLRGGVHFLLYVNTPAMLKDRFQQDVHKIGQSLRDESIRYTGISQQAGKTITVGFRNAEDMDKSLTILSKDLNDYEIKADKKNNQLVFSMGEKQLNDLRQYALTQNIVTLRNKVNALGVAEPVIQQQGADHISVDLPGIQDTARAKAMIGTVATVRLQLVDMKNDPQQAAISGIVPAGDTLYYMSSGPNQVKMPYLLKNDIALSGRSITSATATIDQNSGRPAVSVSTSGSEVSRFYRITSQNIGKLLAVVYVETKTKQIKVDGKIKRMSYPQAHLINVATIQSALSNFDITGLSQQEAKDLALQLRSGAYTAPVSYASEQMIGPSLGKANIRNGVMSCVVGSLLVILFMALYYRLFGLVANMALILNVVFVVAVMSLIGATMTLPGIAGIVLTVGMAVDANVLINERIREELRLGMSPQAAIHAGYERAFATIVDANVTTLIVALILYALGTGSVQGFAVTLIIGLVTSMITAIFFTRSVINLIYGSRQVTQLSIGIKVKSGGK